MGLLFTPWDACLHIGAFPLPAVTEYRIPGAPAFMRGLRLLFVSDVHLRKSVSDARLEALIRRIDGQRADMLLLGGDYGEGEAQCRRFFKALGALSFPLGSFGVPGNNDRWDALPQIMKDAGVQCLRNLSSAVDLPGGRLMIGGCDDHKYGAVETHGLFPAGDYRILLSHFPILPDCACELMLSGHTHGGQMNFLGLTPYSIGFERSCKLAAVRGLHRFGSMRLAVCCGVGVSRLPLRMGAAPELLLLKFDP